jgi:6-hydroxycyclohex-1-ene-1-carbonyl-CoA dehydrogenase
VLGHEVAGTVVACGEGAEGWQDKRVVLSAVIPCGSCELCASGRGNACQRQTMPGNDADGGFATHITARTTGLAEVKRLPQDCELADFSVIADAVSTALQAVVRADVQQGDAAIVVGAGGIGGYTAQIAAARGAQVIAIDVKADRLEMLRSHGAAHAVDASGMDERTLKKHVRGLAKEAKLPRVGWKIFECSGTVPGQQTAFNLLGTAATLAVVGYTFEKGTFRLSNLMAFDATAFGTWGCPMHLYDEAVELVASGTVAVKPFVRHLPLDDIQSAFESAHAAEDPRRAVLIP